jgi:hypothetical protein
VFVQFLACTRSWCFAASKGRTYPSRPALPCTSVLAPRLCPVSCACVVLAILKHAPHQKALFEDDPKMIATLYCDVRLSSLLRTPLVQSSDSNSSPWIVVLFFALVDSARGCRGAGSCWWSRLNHSGSPTYPLRYHAARSTFCCSWSCPAPFLK